MGQLGPFLLRSLEDGNSSPEAFRQTNYSYTTNKHIMYNFPSYFQKSSRDLLFYSCALLPLFGEGSFNLEGSIHHPPLLMEHNQHCSKLFSCIIIFLRCPGPHSHPSLSSIDSSVDVLHS